MAASLLYSGLIILSHVIILSIIYSYMVILGEKNKETK